MPAKTKYELKLGMATREAFGKALVELGRTHPNVVVLDADLSKSTYTAGFAKEFPERFVECGIAESNMMGIAAGLASAGKIPFASSFSVFAMNKGFEQLRVTAAFPKVGVKVPVIYAADQAFRIGEAIELLPGTDVTLLATGLMVA